MATILQFPRDRSLKEITFDLQVVKAKLAVHQARRRDPTDAEDSDWSELEADKNRLKTALAAAFKAVTGMYLSDFEAVMS